MPDPVYFADNQEWLGLGIGGNAAPTVFLPTGDISTSPDIKEYAPDQHRGKLNVKFGRARKTGASVKVTAKGDGRLDGLLEYLLYAALGAKSTPAQQGSTTAYKHVFTEANTRPYLTLWRGIMEDGSILTPEKYTNALNSSLQLSNQSEAELQVNAEFACDTIDLSGADQTPTYSVDSIPFVFPDIDIKLADYGTTAAADTMFTSFEVDIATTITEKQIANQNIFPGVRAPTGYTVNGKFTRIFDNQNMLKEWMGGLANTQITDTYVLKNSTVTWNGPTIADTYRYQLGLTFPAWYIKDSEDPSGDLLEYNCNWETTEMGLSTGVDDMLMKAEVISKLQAIA